MSSLPFPVRVAAGLVVTAVEEVRDLPRTVVGLPISAVSHVLQLSMRAQQVVTELAIRGDTALEGGRPTEEAPSWARFDDEVVTPRAVPAARSNGAAPAGSGPADVPTSLPGYETMTLAEVRSRLDTLTVDDLTELLAWETAHADRPPFVTLLTNRVATLAAET